MSRSAFPLSGVLSEKGNVKVEASCEGFGDSHLHLHK